MIELTIVVPTLNEVGNLDEFLSRLEKALIATEWEVVFVDDDSPDGTADKVRQLARSGHRVRCIQRIGRRGLASACLEGILSSAAPYVAVMDADLQHDEALLPMMLAELKGESLDIVIGSRYVHGGGIGEWTRMRAWMSRVATRISRTVIRADLKDPMSGFFMLRHDVALRSIRAGVVGIGFKVLLDLFASAPRPLRFKELPYQFRPRFAGATKVDAAVVWEYFMMVSAKLVGRWVPVRFVSFSVVGAIGVMVHFVTLTALFRWADARFVVAQAAATIVAMTSNFLLNNMLTYRDLRLRGARLVWGWFTYALASATGSIANVGIAEFLFEGETSWVTSALMGVLIGAVWNYALTSVYTWRTPGRAAT